MLPLPEWAPGVHPLVVHFPLVLPFVAAAADLPAAAGLLGPGLRRAATVLYAAAALALLAGFLSGRAAADGVLLPAEAEALLSAHAEWAVRTAWFFGLYSVLRLGREWRGRRQRQPVLDLPLLAAGLLGLALLVQTGERGAQLVYRYGVGVKAVATGDRRHDHGSHEDTSGAATGQGSHPETHHTGGRLGRLEAQVL